MTRYVHNDVEWAQVLEQDFTEYMSACTAFAYGDDEDIPENFETVSGQPYCGCSDCESREAITFLIPRIIEAYKAGILVEE